MVSMRYAHSEGHTDVCYTDDSQDVITCGTEGDVRVWKGVDDDDQKDLCVGERAWAIAHQGSSLYVGSDNNSVQIYTFPELSNNGVIARYTAPATHIHVSPDGVTVASGSCDMEIHVVNIDTMECTKLLDHKGPILSVCLDPQGKYLVSSSCDGTVKVWEISTRLIVKQWDGLKKSNSFDNSEALSRMDFHPSGNVIALPFCDELRIIERETWRTLKSFTNTSSAMYNIAKFSPCGKLLAAGTTAGDLYVWAHLSGRIVKTESDSYKHAITGLSWKKDCLSLVFCNAMGQLGNLEVPEAAAVSDSEEAVDAPVAADDVPIPEPVFDDDDDDDDNVISLEKIKSQTGFGGSQTSLASRSPSRDADGRSTAVSVKYTSPLSELQEPFQPSSTPQHLQQRFMVWNSHGIIRQYNSEGVEDIDIEYHDTSRNHGLRLNNVAGHTMAALTPQAAILACPKSDDAAPSKIVCVLMKSSDGSKEWDCNMPDGEEIVGIAAGDGWVAVVCDSLLLRLFTIDGTQVDLSSIPGPFVAAASCGRRLTVVFHNGVGVDSQQCLHYMEIAVDSRSKLMTVLSSNPLPIAPKSLLRWVGYSDEESLCSLDSSGMLRLLYREQWRPICSMDNQIKSNFDHFFVIGVSETTQNIRCILCKGAFYPPVIPKPIVNEIKWQIPLCELDSEKGKLEEDYLRNTIVVANATDNSLALNAKSAIEKTISITVMKLFALACKSGLESRALTLCESMPSVDVVRLASKYAAKIGRQHLANKVNEIASNMSKPSYQPPDDIDLYRNRLESPEKYPAEDIAYSQDMFEDSESSSKEKENFIQKMQQMQKNKKKESLSPKPMRIFKSGNPFRKGQEIDSRANVSLDDSAVSEPKMTFMEWYEENRSRLQGEHPLLKEGELAVAAMKQYKQRTQLNSTNPFDDLSQNTNRIEPKKKKTADNKSQPTVDESTVADGSPAAADDELPTAAAAVRKRKADVDSCDDDKPKKKSNSFSKLKAFSFTKSS